VAKRSLLSEKSSYNFGTKDPSFIQSLQTDAVALPAFLSRNTCNCCYRVVGRVLMRPEHHTHQLNLSSG